MKSFFSFRVVTVNERVSVQANKANVTVTMTEAELLSFGKSETYEVRKMPRHLAL